MREDFSDINLLLVARFLTKNSRFNILLILNSKKFGECDRYFVQYLSSSLVRVDGTRSGKMANQNRLRRRNAIIFGYIKSRTVVNGKDKSKKRTRVHGLTVTNNRVNGGKRRTGGFHMAMILRWGNRVLSHQNWKKQTKIHQYKWKMTLIKCPMFLQELFCWCHLISVLLITFL